MYTCLPLMCLVATALLYFPDYRCNIASTVSTLVPHGRKNQWLECEKANLGRDLSALLQSIGTKTYIQCKLVFQYLMRSHPVKIWATTMCVCVGGGGWYKDKPHSGYHLSYVYFHKGNQVYTGWEVILQCHGWLLHSLKWKGNGLDIGPQPDKEHPS